MDDGQAGRPAGDPAGSERYAETGGWPPPSADQRRYEPGTGAAPADPAAGPDPAGLPYGGGPSEYPTGSAEIGGYPSGPAGIGGHPYAAADPGAAPWSPGDSAYGRLSGPAGRPAGPDRRPAARARTARTGGTPVTIGLIVACVLGYLLQQADSSITFRFGLLPVAVEDGEWYRMITAAFLHAGLLHLATNMLTLYIVGAPLERLLRTGRYLTVYLLSALGGSLLSLWLSPAYTIGVGASGAIFGLFGALVVLRRQVGAEAGGLAVLIGLNLVISFTVPNISWQAHVGGLVTGALVAVALAPTLRGRRR